VSWAAIYLLLAALAALAFLVFLVVLGLHARELGRTAGRYAEEVGELADEISREGRRASGRPRPVVRRDRSAPSRR
jgi:hypothetical protein